VITATQTGNEIYEPMSVSRTLVVNAITSIGEVADDRAISVYPNPTSKLLTISLKGFASNQSVSVSFYDMHGHLVMNQNRQLAEELSFNLEALSAGIYNISIAQGKTTKWKRFLKH
jgi:hypothetical protein